MQPVLPDPVDASEANGVGQAKIPEAADVPDIWYARMLYRREDHSQRHLLTWPPARQRNHGMHVLTCPRPSPVGPQPRGQWHCYAPSHREICE